MCQKFNKLSLNCPRRRYIKIIVYESFCLKFYHVMSTIINYICTTKHKKRYYKLK